MRFLIEKIEQQEHLAFVTGKTSVGTIKGIWKYAEPPVVGKQYHIELSIDAPHEINFMQEMQGLPSVGLDRDEIIFKGICEDMDEDVYYLRFDMDWLEMLDVHAVAVKKQIGDSVSFSASIYGIRIYPYTI